MIDSKQVSEYLNGFYPTAHTLTMKITAEMANGLNDAGVDFHEFTKVVARFRAQDPKANWAPTLRQLRLYFPASAAAVQVRPDHEKRWSIWPARLYHAPQRDQFARLWQRGQLIEAFDLLLNIPGLDEGERLDAEANRKWGEAMRRAGDRSAEHYAKFMARRAELHPEIDATPLAELVTRALPPMHQQDAVPF